MKGLPERITAIWLNGLSVAERSAVLRGRFGRNMTSWAASHITHFRWTKRSSLGTRTVNNGSWFFISFEDHLLLVTAAHVYDGFLAAKHSSRNKILCHIGNVEFNPEVRLRSYEKDIDIATFSFTYDELIKIGKQAIITKPWPPPEPVPTNIAFFGGFPGTGRLWVGANAISFGLYLGQSPITVVTDRQISCRFQRADWIEVEGFSMPPPGAELGGISGGPLLLPLDNAEGLWNLYLGGVICQAQTSTHYETVAAVRAHFINVDGSISRV
jgi:hypothetical protein